jgi:hypothetical protein
MNRTIDSIRDAARRGTWSRKNRVAVAATAVTAFTLAAALISPLKMKANNDDVRTFTVDVALGFPVYQLSGKPLKSDDDFNPGDTFVEDGNIYPAGTIPKGKTNFDPSAPGAIGKYRVRGAWMTDLAGFLQAVANDKHAPTDLAFATEMYTLLTDKSTILTDGTWPNAHLSGDRTVVGGTGSFGQFVGEVHEENIGENKYGFCNFRVTFKLRRVQ